MRRLIKSALLEHRKLNIHPELELRQPVFIWKPGEKKPDYYRVSYQLKRRWGKALEPTNIYLATPKASNLFGGPARQGVRLKRTTQATHDLHVSTVYLHYREQHTDLIDYWVSEDTFAIERRRQKLPDAVLKDQIRGVFRVVEFAGSYDTAHVRSFHVDCEKRGTPYELW